VNWFTVGRKTLAKPRAHRKPGSVCANQPI
jgi:hypothetical protein